MYLRKVYDWIIIIIIYSLEFFTSALADGFSLEYEWQQVSSSLQDSSQYSGRSQWYSSLDGLHSSANFRIIIIIIIIIIYSCLRSLQDSSQYSNWSQQCCGLGYLDSIF